MRIAWRTIAPVAIVCITLSCREQHRERTFAGRNPAALITGSGDHVVYVDPASGRLMHQGGDGNVHAVSPAGDRVDLRGENTPLFTARADGALLVVYPVKLGGSHHRSIGELRAELSKDGGRTWSAPRRIDGDVAPRGHNFADLASRPGGETVVSWLDSRAGKQGVQAAVLRPDLSVTAAQTVDPLTCQCCRTALFTSSTGEIWLAYRDLGEGNVRNMAYAVSGRGRPFEPRGDVADDRWSVNGCPESGPRFAESAGGTVWLAWFNGGASAIEVASSTHGAPFQPRGAAASGAVNHPDLGTLPDGRLLLVYESTRGGKRAIDARTSTPANARWTEPVIVAADGASPRYTRRGGRALLTYTSLQNGRPTVHLIDPLPALEGAKR
jgi:hypothetical protein